MDHGLRVPAFAATIREVGARAPTSPMAQSYKVDTYKRHVYRLRPAPRLVVTAVVDLVPDVAPEADADEAVLGAVADADHGPELAGGAQLDDTSPVIAPDVATDDGPSLGGDEAIEPPPSVGGGDVQLDPGPALRGVADTPVVAALGGDVSISSVPAALVPLTELTWIELVAVREDGRPAGTQPYALRTPEGTVRFGRTGPDGKVRLDRLSPGMYGVGFPNLEAEAWAPVAADRHAAAPERTWVEVVLLYDDGSPAAAQRYVVRESDGTLHEGTLGADGKARVDGILAPLCAVSFPDLDGTSWAPVRPKEQASAAGAAAAPADPTAERSWIEVVLVHEDGRPAAGQRYLVREKDGTEREGTLGSDGKARIEGVLAPDCAVTFPDLDGDVWEPQRARAASTSAAGGAAGVGSAASGAGAQDAAPVPSWIEIVLLRGDGTPAEGQRYTVREKSGATHEGTLDADGKARVEGVVAGACQVSFPDLDGADWTRATAASRELSGSTSGG